MDPFSLSTGIVGLVAFALKLVTGALGMIDKTVAAYDEAADELKGLQQDLEQLQTQIIRIHGTLKVLVSNTKDRGFKKLLRDQYGQTAVRDLCDALEETFNTLTQMTDRTNSDNLRPAPLPSNMKSLEFTRAVLKHSFAPSKITDLVKCLRETRSDVQMCLTKLETTFQHANTLYTIMGNGLARITSRTSIFSTSTNLTVRIELAAWLKRWEETWVPSMRRKSTPLPLRGFLQSKRVTVAGISHMTDDLLGKIFYHLCEPGPLSLRHLLFVSRRFYSVAVNDAHLWTTISFDSHFARHFHQWPKQGNTFVEHCLLRSGSLALCLYIDSTDFSAYVSTFLHQPLGIFWKPEWRGLQRCTSMTLVDVGNYAASTIPEIMALLPKSLPSLQYLSLSLFVDPRDGSQFPNCPVLERVEMLSHRGPSPFWGTNFLHVTTLSFGNFTTWREYDVTILSQFPVLHDLTLFTERDGGPQIHRVVQSAKFKHLQILRVHGHIPSWVVSKLVAPALKELHTKADADHLTSIYALESFEPHCQHLYALLPKPVSAKEPEWATNLSRLVQKCTRITSLYISKWMEEECRRFMTGRSNAVLHVQ